MPMCMIKGCINKTKDVKKKKKKRKWQVQFYLFLNCPWFVFFFHNVFKYMENTPNIWDEML